MPRRPTKPGGLRACDKRAISLPTEDRNSHDDQKSRICGRSAYAGRGRRVGSRGRGRPGGDGQHRRGRLRGRDLAGQSEVPRGGGAEMLRARGRPARSAGPRGHRDSAGNGARHRIAAGREGREGRGRDHRRPDEGKRPAPEDARRGQAAYVPHHRPQHARTDDPADQAQCRVRPYGRARGRDRAPVAVRRNRHVADRLGGGEQSRLQPHRVAGRHGGCRRRRLARHAGGRRPDARHRDVSRNDPQSAQVHVGGPRRGAHQAGDRDQVRSSRGRRQGRRDPYRRTVRRRSRGRCGAAPGRHPQGRGFGRTVRCGRDDGALRAAAAHPRRHRDEWRRGGRARRRPARRL